MRAFAAIPHHQFGQMGEPIVLDRRGSSSWAPWRETHGY
jgi:hypothetical protein